MASITVTNSFTNGTVADASAVNQNFTDIINGTSDGSKDFSISALTVAGNLSCTGTINTIGNASSDDFVLTASLASTINIKTTNTYDIGSTTLGLQALYFGANSQTVNLKGSSSMSATWTMTLPVTAGTANYILTTNGSGVTAWTAWSTSAWAATTSALGTVYLPNGMLSYVTTNGYGGSSSGETKARNWLTAVTTTGTAITRTARTTTTADKFNIIEAGVYAVSCSNITATAEQFGLVLNSSQLSTDINSVTASTRLAFGYCPANNTPGSLCWAGRLAANDFLHILGNDAPAESSAPSRSYFAVAQLFRTA
jgi:hypothetical protein